MLFYDVSIKKTHICVSVSVSQLSDDNANADGYSPDKKSRVCTSVYCGTLVYINCVQVRYLCTKAYNSIRLAYFTHTITLIEKSAVI